MSAAKGCAMDAIMEAFGDGIPGDRPGPGRTVPEIAAAAGIASGYDALTALERLQVQGLVDGVMATSDDGVSRRLYWRRSDARAAANPVPGAADEACVTRRPLASSGAETYMASAFRDRGRVDLAPVLPEIEDWACPAWRRESRREIARDSIPTPVREGRTSPVLWAPDDLDAYVARAMARAGGAA